MSTSSKLTRREFQAGTGSLLLGGALVVPLAGAASDAGAGPGRPPATEAAKACDFQRSFMTWDFPFRPDPRPHARHKIPHGNMARILLEAIIDVVDRDTGRAERFVLIAPCLTEWVYAEDRLFQLPSSEYRNIYSLTEQRSMGRGMTYTDQPSRGTLVKDHFRSLKIDVCTYGRTRRLDTPAAIVQATAANLPLVARTHLDDPARAVRYVLEYPIKTMNFQPKTDSFQVDTGPLLVPDSTSGADRAIDRLEMAFVAYNRLDRAEFILRRPTPVTDPDGKTLCNVLHYSEVCELDARNEILAGEA